MREVRAKVEIDGELVRLDEASHLVRVLSEASLDSWRMGVYTKKEYVERVAKAAAEYFGIERTVQRPLDFL